MRRTFAVALLRGAVLFGSIAGALPASTAFAQPSSGNPARDRARSLAEEGKRLMNAGRPAEALAKFREADATFHAVTLTVLIARALVEIGRPDQAHAEYTRAVDERLPADAPPEWAEGQGVAAKERSELGKRLGFLRFEVRGMPPSTIAIDGREVDPKGLVAVLPGGHKVTWSADGTERSSAVQVSAGQEIVVSLTRQGMSMGKGGRSGDGPWLILSIASLSVGVAGIGLGIGAGVYALDQKSAIEAACDQGGCLASAGDAIASGTTASHLSTIGFAVGGATLAAGAVFLGLALSQGPSREAPPARPRPRAQVRVSPLGVAVEGTFW